MMLIPTTLAPSPIEGFGVFAETAVPKGTVVWQFTPGFDQVFTKGQISTLPRVAQKYIGRYAYQSRAGGTIILCADHAKFFNHSDTPNTATVYSDAFPEGATIAVRDIEAGEELTADYHDFTDEIEMQ